jgi:hypothetical protein
MPRVIFLVGLSGSGKTRKGTKMQKEDRFVWVDSIEHRSEDGTRENYRTLIDHLRRGQNCVAEELQTLDSSYRARIDAELKKEVRDLEVEFWFFEKDLVKATRNVLSRPDDKKKIKEHLLINCDWYHRYVLPTDPATVILQIEEPTLYIDP